MMEKPPDELVLDMTSERCFPATDVLLKQKDMNDDMIVQILKLFSRACECQTTQTRLTKLLSILPTSFYFSRHLSSYIMRWENFDHFETKEHEDELHHMIKVFAELLQKLPSCYPHLPIPQLSYTTNHLIDKGVLCNQGIQTAVEELIALKDEMAEKVKKEVEEMGKNPKGKRRRNEVALRDNEAPPDDFRHLSVTPTIDDVHTQGPLFLRRNKVEGKYNDPEHYLDVQFRLLREDFVRPLREGIQKLLENVESGNLKHLQDVRVYTGIRVLYPIFTTKGLTHIISFDVSKLKKVRWENSKRLIYGSLLCLSKDNFETFLLAIVEQRKEEDLKKGMLEVRFTDVSDLDDLCGVEFQMVETTAYFEAYRHVLEGLKSVNPETLPFQRYIVECESDIQPPAYLRNRMREEVTYDLSPIMKRTKRKRLQDLTRNQDGDRNQGLGQDQDGDKDQGLGQDHDGDKDQGLGQDHDGDKDQGLDQDQDGDKDQGLNQDQDGDKDQGLGQDQDGDKDQGLGQDHDGDKDQGLDQDQDGDKDQGLGQDRDLGLMDDLNQDQTQHLDPDEEQVKVKNHDQKEKQAREKKYGKAVRILDMNSWPNAEDLELDSSQLKAVQLALTNEFAIIQGPPGTGKTYIGLKVVKVLLHNKNQWERGTETRFDGDLKIRGLKSEKLPARPILVVCYTNHALDQFLEGILHFHAHGIVRVGGQCKNEKINKFSINNIEAKMHKEKKVPHDVHCAVQEARQDLKLKSSELKTATRNLQKCKENIIHERELKKENIISHEQYESLISRFRNLNHRDPSAVTVNCVMLYWLNLLPNPYEAHNSPVLTVKPVARFAFDRTYGVANLVRPSHTAVVNDAHFLPGLHGRLFGSLELKGRSSSYITIPNGRRHFLDTRFSMTILMHVYPVRRGPILCFYHPQSDFIGIQIAQVGFHDGKGVISVSFNSRDGRCFRPITKAVLNMNEWNFIAASYDHDTGYTRLWHNGVMVEEKRFPRIEIASDLQVFIGSLNVPRRQWCFQGRICCLEIYPKVLHREQIMAVAGIRHEDLQTEEQEKPDTDVQMEAAVIQEQRQLHDDNQSENVWDEHGEDKSIEIADQFESTGNKMDLSRSQKKRLRKTILKKLTSRAVMRIPEAKSVKDVWALKLIDRWRLYRRWVIHVSSRFRDAITKNQRAFELSAQELKEAHYLEDLFILREADVIGMTTTGAAKYRHLIQQIKPRITIVEEAAEVLEAHIVTSLSPGCQHLILIGDHQQLRPNPNVYRLATDYNLDVSLFERMVKNGMKIERLRAQHRMRPEIARMMEPIYDDLENHESVLNLENIKGVGSNIFFIEHTELEELIEEGKSRSNVHEAKYLAALCRYFILQGYHNEQITILTMYTGQLIQLKKELVPKEFFQGVRVCAVDNFQGEENDIILLSLVRSNEEGSIGFLRTSNRVCVALSRAKKGFYCIGNLELMCEQKESLWKHIIDDMRNEGKVGPFLTLMCQNHPKTILHASKPEDFRKAPEGGCTEPCKARLDCGHVCKLHCHPTDPKHIEYQCKEKCLRTCELKHKCRQRCYEKCDPCDVLVSKEIPSCGHYQEVPCYKDPATLNCLSPCERICRNGHKCRQRCYEKCVPCDILVSKEIPSCGHYQEVPCHMDPADFKCQAPCKRTCPHGHSCKQRCFEKCKPCSFLVSKTMPSCKHVQKIPCHLDPGKFSCEAPCKHSCKLGHQCKKPCHEACGPCDFLLQKKMPLCDHYQQVPCHVDPSTVECQAPCQRSCDKGHRDCKLLCYQECQPCKALTLKTIPSCNHEQQVPCHMLPQDFKCQAQCSKSLPCSHPCQNKCSIHCNSKCRQIVIKQFPCGHHKELECHKKPKDVPCTIPCDVLLKCNHFCQGNCSQCLCGRFHKPCLEKCAQVLFCGHCCSDVCANNCPPCQKKCDNKCTHGICKKTCKEPCNPCTKPCNWKCQHFKCTKLCSEPCDRPRCDKPCRKKPFKKCHHRCIGMCGEPCPKKCRICDKEEVTQHLFGNESNQNARFVEVHPCGHIIEVKAMDKLMDDSASASSMTLRLIRCPRCKAPIKTCARYGNIIKAKLIDLEKVKAKTAVDKKELTKIAAQLKAKMSEQMDVKTFPNEAKLVAKSLDRKNITRDHVNMCEKQIHFMNCFSGLLTDGNRVQRGRHYRGINFRKVMANLERDVSDLVSRVVAKGRTSFSHQETGDIYSAMQGMFLKFLYDVSKGELTRSSLPDIKKAIESRTPYDEAVFHRFKEKLQKVLSIQLSDDPWRPLKDVDRVVKVLYLTQEHWVKCPEGHVYHVHDVDSQGHACPECQSMDSTTSRTTSALGDRVVFL